MNLDELWDEEAKVFHLLATELAVVYTEEYALEIMQQIADNVSSPGAWLLNQTPNQEASKYMTGLFEWKNTKEGAKYWNQIYTDLLEFEIKVIKKIMKKRKRK